MQAIRLSTYPNPNPMPKTPELKEQVSRLIHFNDTQIAKRLKLSKYKVNQIRKKTVPQDYFNVDDLPEGGDWITGKNNVE